MTAYFINQPCWRRVGGSKAVLFLVRLAIRTRGGELCGRAHGGLRLASITTNPLRGLQPNLPAVLRQVT